MSGADRGLRGYDDRRWCAVRPPMTLMRRVLHGWTQLRRAPQLAFLGLALVCPGLAVAQTPPATGIAPPKQAAPASMTHALAKATTLNVGVGVASLAIYSIGTGSLVDGGLLAAGTVALGYSFYAVNEYLWELYKPNTNLSANNASFDTTASLWRNTGKYITFKTGVLASKFGLVYLYTGSIAATAILGSATSLAFPVLFYANNMGWDWYDWRAAPAAAMAAKQ
jgi:uncharacterized membrane protein